MRNISDDMPSVYLTLTFLNINNEICSRNQIKQFFLIERRLKTSIIRTNAKQSQEFRAKASFRKVKDNEESFFFNLTDVFKAFILF
jgi:hypothetical protein